MKTKLTNLALALWLGWASVVAADAQEASPKLPTGDELAKDNKLFLTLASKTLKWEEPTEPCKIAGPLYYVGSLQKEILDGTWKFPEPKPVK